MISWESKKCPLPRQNATFPIIRRYHGSFRKYVDPSQMPQEIAGSAPTGGGGETPLDSPVDGGNQLMAPEALVVKCVVKGVKPGMA